MPLGGGERPSPFLNLNDMIKTGNTIVYKNGNGSLDFYWLVDIRPSNLVFFDWYSNPRKATAEDYWVVSTKRFESLVKDGTIEVFDSLPEKYLDIFEQQAIERNN